MKSKIEKEKLLEEHQLLVLRQIFGVCGFLSFLFVMSEKMGGDD